MKPSVGPQPPAYGWTPFLSEADGIYRAWMRNPDGRRIETRTWHPTPDDAARELIAKITPMVPR